MTAQSGRSTPLRHAATRPARPDFRCDRKIELDPNSHIADEAVVRFVFSVDCFSLVNRFDRKVDRANNIKKNCLNRSAHLGPLREKIVNVIHIHRGLIPIRSINTQIAAQAMSSIFPRNPWLTAPTKDRGTAALAPCSAFAAWRTFSGFSSHTTFSEKYALNYLRDRVICPNDINVAATSAKAASTSSSTTGTIPAISAFTRSYMTSGNPVFALLSTRSCPTVPAFSSILSITSIATTLFENEEWSFVSRALDFNFVYEKP